MSHIVIHTYTNFRQAQRINMELNHEHYPLNYTIASEMEHTTSEDSKINTTVIIKK